jgi:glycosyltransferase involved in cell wall biosynthesis
VHGVIVGDGPLRHTLEREAEQLGLTQIVRFMGWQQDLRAVYEGLDVTCLTSWNEGTPLALIEAMAAGRADVATDVGGVRDVLDPDGGSREPIRPGEFRQSALGVLVRPGDVGGLVAALGVMAGDRALRARLGEAARASVVQRFSAVGLIRDMTRLYESVLQPPPR